MHYKGTSKSPQNRLLEKGNWTIRFTGHGGFSLHKNNMTRKKATEECLREYPDMTFNIEKRR